MLILDRARKIELKKDDKTGKMVDAETGETVHFYVDTRSKDTIDGRTGKVVNGKLEKRSSGSYVYINDENDEFKVKSDDYKMKVEKDGDIKIKDGDKKIKIDGETGEKKVKKD